MTGTASGLNSEFLARIDGQTQVGAENWSSQDLRGADLRTIRFEGTDFTKACLTSARFRQVQHANFSNANMQFVTLINLADLHSDVFMISCNFSNTNLKNANLQGGDFDRSTFENANLRGANFARTRIQNSHFRGADLAGANLAGATFGHSILEAKNFSRALGIEYTSNESITKEDLNGNSISFFDKNINWEKIRTVGNLPLFGISYFSLVFLSIVILFKNYYNILIDYLITHDDRFSLLRYSTIDWNEWFILFSSLFISIASTIYKFRCPERVAEYNSTQWIDGLQKPALAYYAECWKSPISRIICAIFYIMGGIFGILLFLQKIFIVISIMTSFTH